jgi:uncharacterized protein YjbI with pentapeptide repeats
MTEQQAISACPHPEAVGTRWGDPISEERQGELQGYLDRWAAETDHGERKGPFDSRLLSGEEKKRHLLTGADVSWLAEHSGYLRDPELSVPHLHLESANLNWAHLEGAVFANAHLESANLYEAHLAGANFRGTHLEHASLHATHLEGADLTMAILQGVALEYAHLEGAQLFGAQLEGAFLVNAWLDSKTVLAESHLDSKTRLGDIQWGGVGAVNLTRINWEKVPTLGDERDVGFSGEVWQHENVVRAYRQLATQLRVQGINEVADRFAYRAQVRQRRVFLRRFRIPQYLGSLFLDLISGYGYRPVRSLIAYVLVILGFAATYFALGGANGQALSWNEAIVISMTAFHGRGFFSAVFQPGDLQAAVAAVEAFIGLLIEIVLIATFTQRFFAR